MLANGMLVSICYDAIHQQYFNHCVFPTAYYCIRIRLILNYRITAYQMDPRRELCTLPPIV